MAKAYPGHLPSDKILEEIEHILKRHAGDQQNLIEMLRYLPTVLSDVKDGDLAGQRNDILKIKGELDAAFAKILAANEAASGKIDAAGGHLLESADVARQDKLADKMTDIAQKIKFEPLRVESDSDITRAFLHVVKPAIFTAEFNQLEPTRQRELMPELFMDGGNNGST